MLTPFTSAAINWKLWHSSHSAAGNTPAVESIVTTVKML
jgi:hypothetical protein